MLKYGIDFKQSPARLFLYVTFSRVRFSGGINKFLLNSFISLLLYFICTVFLISLKSSRDNFEALWRGTVVLPF